MENIKTKQEDSSGLIGVFIVVGIIFFMYLSLKSDPVEEARILNRELEICNSTSETPCTVSGPTHSNQGIAKEGLDAVVWFGKTLLMGGH